VWNIACIVTSVTTVAPAGSEATFCDVTKGKVGNVVGNAPSPEPLVGKIPPAPPVVQPSVCRALAGRANESAARVTAATFEKRSIEFIERAPDFSLDSCAAFDAQVRTGETA
jgi:hypothetical protein